jgi:hypothetical protein
MVQLPTETCFFCERPFIFGEQQYYGQYIHQWELCICDVCRSLNWDGINPRYEPRLLAHLSERLLLRPGRNARGLLVLACRVGSSEAA